MEETTPQTTTPRRRFDWREHWDDPRRLLALLLAVVYAAVLFFGFSWSRCFFSTCPNVAKLAAFQPGGAPVLLDRNGEAFADLAPSEREIVPLSALPSLVPQAFLSVEDQRFYEHRGVDWRRVGGAIFADLRAGGFAQGFSTISMQLARNVFPERIPGEQQTTRRKLLEIRVAQDIEHRYSKEEILELYLNNIYFGNRARGIEAASRQYFGHSAKELTLPEAALLAGLPKAPSHYDPRRHPDEALTRRNLVLALMRDQGRIPRYLAEKARLGPLGIVPAPRQARTEAGLAPYFAEQVRRELEERFGPNLYTRPLRIVTTLDSAAQRAAEEELRRQLKLVESGGLGAFQGTRYASETEAPEGGTPYLQGAAVMLDAHDGDVLAWVGGRDFAQSQFDRVIQARRQPGSAFKPFVYAAALADGWALSQPLLDQPLKVKLSSGQLWQPKNFSDRYDGQVTMRDALVRSKNVPTVRLADAVGLDEVVQAAHRAGIAETIASVPSLALGTVAVSPLELTTAYSGFASLGQAVEPRLLLRVEDEKGKVIWRSEPRRHAVMDPGVAFLITDVLAESLVSGTGNLVQQTGLKAPAAGKTGTTNEGADAWFVGYTPEIVGGVWIGFDKPRPILDQATGGRLAAPVWGRMLARVYQTRPAPKPWTAPASVVSLPVDPPTGLLIARGCAPQSGAARNELFLRGKEPAAYCPGREAPPENGFPARRGQIQRDEEAKQETRQIAQAQDQARAQAQAQAQAQARKQQQEQEKEQERIARLETAKRQENEKLAQLSRQEEQQKKKAAASEQLAQKLAAAQRAARTEKERADLQARQERLARQEEAAKLAAGKRERDRAAQVAQAQMAQEKAAALDRRAREAAAREEALLQKGRARRQEESVSQVVVQERRAQTDEEGDAAPPQRDRSPQRREPAVEREATAEADLSGWWELTNTIESTNYSAYKGLRLTYRVQLEQDGDRVTGRGQKWAEDGGPVSAGARSPINLTGRVEGRRVILQYTERGARRTTSGSFTFTLSADAAALRGAFSSTAAAASGAAVARRMR